MWTETLRFIQTLDIKTIYKLQNLLVLPGIAIDSNSVSTAVYQVIAKVVLLSSSIKHRMDSHFKAMISKCEADLCVELIEQNLGSREWFGLFLQTYRSMIQFDEYLTSLDAINTCILNKMEVDEDYRIRPTQTNSYATFLANIHHWQSGLTNNFWAHLMDVTGKWLKANRFAEIDKLTR